MNSMQPGGKGFLATIIRKLRRLARLPGGSARGGANGGAYAALGRSTAIRVVNCGSDGAVEQEILAIFNPVYNAERYGFHLVASPRHADILLVSGPLTRNMEGALLAAFEAMSYPRRVVTIGDAITGQGMFHDSYAVVPLPEAVALACVAHIPGDPPCPADILAALRQIPEP
jgi:Ni,Fe-hydrogenase III small subunit